jgi:hypothetical protein
MQEARLTGTSAGMNEFMRAWEERNLSDYRQVPGRKSKETIRKLTAHSVRRGQAAHGPGYQNVYWEEHYSKSRFHPAVCVFKDEWDAGYGRAGFFVMPAYDRPPEYPARTGGADSYLDFQCWYGAEFIRRGIGLYFDNTFPKISYNPVTTPAYRHEDGTIHPSAEIWWQREYFKRIWVLHQQLAPAETPPIMMFHMTNTHILPTMSFGQSNLDLEWKYGPEVQQSKYPPDMLRTEAMGLQTGNVPLVLAGVHDTESEEQKRRAQRSRFGTMMVHEIRFRYHGPSRQLMQKVLEFDYGRDQCRVRNYWDNDYPVSTGDEKNVKSILLRRGDRLMLVLTTWNENADTVTVTVDEQALGVKLHRAKNAETGDPIALNNGQMKLDLTPYAVRVVRLE